MPTGLLSRRQRRQRQQEGIVVRDEHHLDPGGQFLDVAVGDQVRIAGQRGGDQLEGLGVGLGLDQAGLGATFGGNDSGVGLALGRLPGLLGLLLALLDHELSLLGLLFGNLLLLDRGGVFGREGDVAQNEVDRTSPLSDSFCLRMVSILLLKASRWEVTISSTANCEAASRIIPRACGRMSSSTYRSFQSMWTWMIWAGSTEKMTEASMNNSWPSDVRAVTESSPGMAPSLGAIDMVYVWR